MMINLEVELCGAADELMRVLTVLRRRGCRVTSVDFAAADRHYGGRLRIGLVPPPRHAHCVPAWVENVVGVRRARPRECPREDSNLRPAA